MKRPITDFEFRYRITGGSFGSWTGCNSDNTTDNLNDTYTVITIPIAAIAIGDFQVRVKSISGAPAGAILANDVAFTTFSSLDTTILSPFDTIAGNTVKFIGFFDHVDNTITDGKVEVLKNLKTGSSIGDLSQSNSSKRPTYFSTGGGNDLGYAKFVDGKILELLSGVTIPQPFTIHLFLRQTVEHNHFKYLVNLHSSSTVGIFHIDSGETPPILTLAAGVNFQPIYKGSFKQKWMLGEFTFNGLDSKICFDKQPAVFVGTNSPGADGCNQIILGNDDTDEFDLQAIVITEGELTEEQSLRLGNYFNDRYGLTTAAYGNAWGDSITVGFNATDKETQSYMALVQAEFGFDFINKAVSGGRLNYPSDLPLSFMPYYLTKELIKSNIGWIFLCYGTNDIIDLSWKNDMLTVVTHFLDYGYDPNKFVLISPPYQSDKVVKLELLVEYLTDIAAAKGVIFADCYSYMEVNGGDTLLADGTHPNDAGHAIMAQVIIDAVNNA